MKHKLITLITTTLALFACSSCGTPTYAAAAMEIGFTTLESVESTDTGTLYNFADGTGFYLETSDLGNIYPLTGIVTHIEYEAIPDEDLILIACANGNEFSFYAPVSDGWCVEDLATCIMDSNGTLLVYDDEVLIAHYAGTLSQLNKIKC